MNKDLVSYEAPRYEEMSKVVELYVQNVNPTQISKRLGIKRKDVLDHIEDWRKTSVGMDIMKDRVEELISTMDLHYSTLIGKYYEIINEADTFLGSETSTHQLMAQKANAIKGVAELERQRIDTLQKSGLLEAADMGNAVAEMEEKQAILMEILRNDLCRICKPIVMSKLSEVTGQVTPIVVHPTE